jgi:peptidyl-prolyl cis-trans isomerase D
MAPGSISDLVETNYGYHIIRLTELKGATQGLEQKKPEIRGNLMYQKALAQFAEVAETFSNLVYEQSTSLEPAANQFKLQPQKSDWLSREEAAKFFKNNDRLAAAIFSDEVRKEGRNTEAVEVGPNTLAACRVIDSRPASYKPFDDVKSQIEEAIRKKEAAVMAATEGKKALDLLKQGQNVPSLVWSAPASVARDDPQGLTGSVVTTAFKMDVAKLPSHTGATSSDGSFVLIKVSAAGDGVSTLDQDSRQRSQAELNMQLSSEYLAAYIKSLRSAAKIKINEALLLKSE